MNQYDAHKICFIICTNNEQYLRECLLYISLLAVPRGYETEVLTIQDAPSMTAGYNEGMRTSNARYKVYLHQDTFIVEKHFIRKLLTVFQSDPQIGIVGMIGAEHLSGDAVMWHEERCGNFYRLDELQKDGLIDGIVRLKSGVKEVEVVDGLLMATQYDLPWREDILKGWDFYDVSQCLEFRRAGYKIVVPGQRQNWVIHAYGAPAFWDYEKNRQILLWEYPEIAEKGGAKDRMLRILFYRSTSIQILDLPYALESLGHHVTLSKRYIELCAINSKEVEAIEEELEEGNYDLVVTFDYSFTVSKACENMQVKYYAWIYDSPMLGLYTEYAESPFNYYSVFDKKQYERMKERGLKNLFYLPLCAEVEVFGSTNITKRDEKKYTADIAFVGRLYDHRGYRNLFDENSQKLKAEFDALAAGCRCRWDGETTIFGKASDELADYIAGRESEDTWKIYRIDRKYYCESIKLAGRCNELERTEILNKLAEKYKVVLYSDDSAKEMLRNVKVKPWLDYWMEMPKVFHLSKINLNITSRSIESGIPQRVWDILAVGGFCLTNYQPELEDFFEIGKDLEVYHNLQELEEKTAYYLKHEKQRIRIAMNGYQKVKKYHTYDVRLQGVLKLIFGEDVNENVHSNG